MFDIGFQELVIIFVVALLVFGPKRLPEVGRTLGKWIGELRKGIYDAKTQMESEFDYMKKGAEEDKVKKVDDEKAGESAPAGGENQEGDGEKGGDEKK